MTTHGPDWFRVATIPGVSPEAAVHVRREFQDALGTLPRTADEAVAWAHREYATAQVAAKTASTLDRWWQRRRRRHLLTLAQTAYLRAQWMLMEEARLRRTEIHDMT